MQQPGFHLHDTCHGTCFEGIKKGSDCALSPNFSFATGFKITDLGQVTEFVLQTLPMKWDNSAFVPGALCQQHSAGSCLSSAQCPCKAQPGPRAKEIIRSYTLIKMLSPPSSEVLLTRVTSPIMLSYFPEKQQRSKSLCRHCLQGDTQGKMPLGDLPPSISKGVSKMKSIMSFHSNMKDLPRFLSLDLYPRNLVTLQFQGWKQSLQY